MRTLRSSFLVPALVLAGVSYTPAQTALPAQRFDRPIVTGVFGFGPATTMISPRAHAPFSATLAGQAEQTLNDGTNITRENQEVAMRDADGRIYRARRLGPHAGRSETESRVMITITDPVRHVQYTCPPIGKVCMKFQYRPQPKMRQPALEDPGRPDVIIEDLGPSNISGVEVEGKRIIRTVPEGTVGNDRPFTTTEETWHSRELDVDVQVKHTDPRSGTRTTTMTEVRRGEPDPKYFQIPEGYRVEERKPPHGAMAPLTSSWETVPPRP